MARQVAVPADLEHRSPLVAQCHAHLSLALLAREEGLQLKEHGIETRIEDQARRDALDDTALSSAVTDLGRTPARNNGETCAGAIPNCRGRRVHGHSGELSPR